VPASSYLTIARDGEAEIVVKRSRFLCWLRWVEDEDAARLVVEQARKQHWGARHHCSAFVLGPDARIQRSHDDGEPSGTAGAPMLEVLRGREVSDVAGRLEHEMRARGVRVRAVEYDERATLRLGVRLDDLPVIEELLASATGGAARPREAGTGWVDVPAPP
jgi:hypothetical protein